jgi:hypothetical protein
VRLGVIVAGLVETNLEMCKRTTFMQYLPTVYGTVLCFKKYEVD